EPGRAIHQAPVVERDGDHHQDEAQADGVELLELQPRVPAGEGRGEDGGHADAEQDERGGQEAPVDVEEQAAVDGHGYCGPCDCATAGEGAEVCTRSGAGEGSTGGLSGGGVMPGPMAFTPK